MIPSWVLLDEAADIAGCLLREAFGVAQKRTPLDPLDDHDFELILKQLFASLVRAVAPEDARALQGVQTMLDLDWPGMSASAREQAIRTIAKGLGGVPSLVVGKVDKILNQQGPALVAATKREAVASYDLPIKGSFTLVDQRVIDAARKSQAHYIRDEYGKRIVLASVKARDIVAHGLEQGLDRYEIGDRLKPAMEAIGVNRSVGYFRMIASVFAARARTWGVLSAFTEAGIEYMEFVAVLDEVTSPVCRFMDGKVFRVAAARERHEQVAAASDPEAVVELQPWVHAARAKDGSQALVFRRGDERVPIAGVERSGVGAKNDTGEFSKGWSTDKLERAGICAPPLHAHCRSQLVPASATPSKVQVPAAAPVGSSLTSNVLPYAGGKAPLDETSPPAVLPPPAAFRPPPSAFPLGFNPEALPALPAFTAAEVAARQAQEAKEQAIHDALDKLAALPKASPVMVKSPLPTVASLGPSWLAPKPTKAQLAGGKKKKPVNVLVDEVHGLESFGLNLATSFTEKFDPKEPVLLVKQNGTLTPANAAESYKLLAANLHGQTSLPAKIVDLDKLAAKKPKPPVVAPPPPAPAAPPALPKPVVSMLPPKKPDASVILHQQVGQQKGSNEGGFYKGSDGVDRYVKFYDEEGKAECEHLANALYRDLGHVAPESVLFEHKGKVAFASVILPGAKTLRDVGHSAERSKKILEGFVADVLVANWDVVGVGNGGGDDNVVFLPDGRVARIDNGGSFLMKGLTGRKPSAALNAITEWDKFFDPGVNFNYARMAKAAGVTSAEDMKDVVVAGIQQVLALEKASGGWAAYVDKHVPKLSAADQSRIAEMLTARSKLLAERLADLTRPAPAPGQPRFLAKQYSTVLPRPGLALSDLPETAVLDDHEGKIDVSDPKRLPSGESYSSYEARAKKAVEKISGAELQGIRDFTSSGYTSIRESEERGQPDSRSDAIQRALATATPEPGTVWRGITGLPEAVVRKYLEAGVIQLGKRGGATSSTSWNIDVALNFMSSSDDPPTGEYKILYKIHGKTQVPVETISSVGNGERELMFGREAAFRVTGLSRPKGRQRILVVEAEELVGAERDAAMGGKGSVPKHAGPPPPAGPASATPDAKDDALMKLAVMPKAGPGQIVNPVAVVGGKSSYFTPASPAPVDVTTIPQDKIKEAKSKPFVYVDPSAVTLHSKNVAPSAVKALIENTPAHDQGLLAVKAGGKLYMFSGSAEPAVAACQLLGTKLPVHVIDMDSAAAAPPPYVPPTESEKQEALAKIAAMPKSATGQVVNPLVATYGAQAHFSASDPPPLKFSQLPKEKKKAAQATPVQSIATSQITLPEEHTHIAPALLAPLVTDGSEAPEMLLVKSGGKLYTTLMVDSAMVGALHLLNKPVPAKIIDLD